MLFIPCLLRWGWNQTINSKTLPQMKSWKYWWADTNSSQEINRSQEIVMWFTNVLSWYLSILSILFRISSLTLGQSYDCPGASRATLKIWVNKPPGPDDATKITQTQYNCLHILSGTYCPWHLLHFIPCLPRFFHEFYPYSSGLLH